jgi:L-ascorbate metabolism protein UlaG (beta-lactamase superfamily)
MHIKKLKHCCMVITVKTASGERRIVTDPGFYSLEEHDKIQHADIVLITHEHADHFHIESLKAMIKRIPSLSVIANDSVGELLTKEGIEHHIMEHGDKIDLKDIHIEAYGKKHAVIHKSIPMISNVGFFIENRLFYPGDAFTDPKRPVDVLALPVAGPWMKLSEAIDYTLKLKPRLAFPVHDAIRSAPQHTVTEKILGQFGIEFAKLEEGGELEVK